MFEKYERAFSETTGMPVAFRPVESWQMPHRGKRNESPFCAMMAQKSRACAACLQVQQELSEKAAQEACTVTCLHGMCDTAIPVRAGDHVLGYLQTGQVFSKSPARRNSSAAPNWRPNGALRRIATN